MAAAEITQALTGHVWLAPLTAVPWLFLTWVRTHVNIVRARAWDRTSQDIGVSKDERHKLFVNATQRDLKIRDST
jgi:hypothetical protein